MTEDQQHHIRNGIQVCKYLCKRIKNRSDPGSMTRAEAETILDRLQTMSLSMEESCDVQMSE